MSIEEPSIVITVEPLHPVEAQVSLPTQRDSELVLAHLLERRAAAGDAGPFLDFTVIDSETWRHRFLMMVDNYGSSVLLLWGLWRRRSLGDTGKPEDARRDLERHRRSLSHGLRSRVRRNARSRRADTGGSANLAQRRPT